MAGASAGAGARWHGPRQTSSRLDLLVDSSAAAAALLGLRRVRDGLSLLLRNIVLAQSQFVYSPIERYKCLRRKY